MRSYLRLRWAGIGLVIVLIAACGSSGRKAANPTTTRPTSTVGTATTATTSVTGETSTSVALPPSTTTTGAGPTFASISGSYNAGTADGGWLYIRSDGASRFRGPDGVACPDCTTAGSPIAVLDFSLTSLSSAGTGAYRASGTIMGTSDPTWARQISASATVASPISLTIASGGHLSMNILPANDGLAFSSKTAPSSTATPCTVAAVTGPVVASANGQTERVTGVSCSIEGEWAAASVAVGGQGQGQGGFDMVVLLAGNGGNWIVVDRPTICNHHDVTPSFFNTACGTS